MGSDVIKLIKDTDLIKTRGMIIGNQFGEIQRSNNTTFVDGSNFVESTQAQYENRILNSGQLFYGWSL